MRNRRKFASVPSEPLCCGGYEKGDVITAKNMRSMRPGLGLSPKYYDVVLGKKVIRDVNRGSGLVWDFLSVDEIRGMM